MHDLFNWCGEVPPNDYQLCILMKHALIDESNLPVNVKNIDIVRPQLLQARLDGMVEAFRRITNKIRLDFFTNRVLSKPGRVLCSNYHLIANLSIF